MKQMPTLAGQALEEMLVAVAVAVVTELLENKEHPDRAQEGMAAILLEYLKEFGNCVLRRWRWRWQR